VKGLAANLVPIPKLVLNVMAAAKLHGIRDFLQYEPLARYVAVMDRIFPILAVSAEAMVL
jgi:hypothetical protein